MYLGQHMRIVSYSSQDSLTYLASTQRHPLVFLFNIDFHVAIMEHEGVGSPILVFDKTSRGAFSDSWHVSGEPLVRVPATLSHLPFSCSIPRVLPYPLPHYSLP